MNPQFRALHADEMVAVAGGTFTLGTIHVIPRFGPPPPQPWVPPGPRPGVIEPPFPGRG